MHSAQFGLALVDSVALRRAAMHNATEILFYYIVFLLQTFNQHCQETEYTVSGKDWKDSLQPVQYTLYSILCTVYSVYCTLYTATCTLHTAMYAVYTSQCTLHSEQCTV